MPPKKEAPHLSSLLGVPYPIATATTTSLATATREGAERKGHSGATVLINCPLSHDSSVHLRFPGMVFDVASELGLRRSIARWC